MLSHKQCQKALSLIRKDWNPYPPEPVNIPAIAGNPEKIKKRDGFMRNQQMGQ